jgi:hypothetical protein
VLEVNARVNVQAFYSAHLLHEIMAATPNAAPGCPPLPPAPAAAPVARTGTARAILCADALKYSWAFRNQVNTARPQCL